MATIDMKRVIFIDLDDTLFQTARKRPSAERVAAVDREGRPLSFQCDRQAAFLDWLAQDAEVVPVTGRNVAAYNRVVLPLGRHAICSFGGVILEGDGAPNAEWHARMAAFSENTRGTLERLDATVGAAARQANLDVRHRIITDAALPLYVSIKSNTRSADDLGLLADRIVPALPNDWTLHHNGTNMALLPPFLGKRSAVDYLLRHVLDQNRMLTIGIGDSVTDLGFMSLCDFVMAPAESQIVARWLEDGTAPAVAEATDASA